MADCILAHDLGTTGDKAALFTADGALIASYFASYPTSRPGAGRAEQDPSAWWDAACEATRALLRRAPEAAGKTLGVGLCGMMNGCLLLDVHGEPLGHCLIHADTRATAQAARIAAQVGEMRAFRRTGNRVAPYFTLAKLAWFAEHEPDLMRRARWCVQAKDYFAWRLTGQIGFTDRSDASLTGCFDMETGTWCEDLAAVAGFPLHLLPEIVSSSSRIGCVTHDAARDTGLIAGTPVFAGGGDGACATAGAGAVRDGSAYHYLGGTSWVAAVTSQFRPDPDARVSALCALDASQYVTYGTVQAAGTSVDWARSQLLADRPGEGWAAIEALASESPPGSRGLLFLPYLEGERSPIWDANARGAFVGLTTAHTRADLARSVFEGVALALGQNLSALMGLVPEITEVRGLGGGMRGDLWPRIIASAYGRPLRLMKRLAEATSAGAAMSAAVGLGLYRDYAAAADRFAPTGDLVMPDPEATALYNRAAPVFAALYRSLKPTYPEIAALAL